MLVWTEDLSTGIEKVDSQHKEIINKVNQLYLKGTEGSEQDEIMSMLAFLEEYIVTHFREEEAYQESSKYPRVNEHKASHRDLEKKVIQLKQQAKTEGATATLIATANQMLGDWLIKHIRREDKEFAVYYRDAVGK